MHTCYPYTTPSDLMQRLEQPHLFLSEQLRRTAIHTISLYAPKKRTGISAYLINPAARPVTICTGSLNLCILNTLYPVPQTNQLLGHENGNHGLPEKTTSHQTFLAVHNSCRSLSHVSTSTSGLTPTRLLRSRGNNARSTTCRRCNFNSSITDFKNQKRLRPSSADGTPHSSNTRRRTHLAHLSAHPPVLLETRPSRLRQNTSSAQAVRRARTVLKNVDGGRGCGWMSAFRCGIGPKRRRHFLEVGG